VLECCSFLGPLEKLPFNGSIIHLLAVLAVAFFSGIIANKAGMLFSEHPDSPRTSMLQPVQQAAMNTVRLIDNFTDIHTIRLVIGQVCSWRTWLQCELCHAVRACSVCLRPLLGNLSEAGPQDTRYNSVFVQRSRGCVWFGEPGRCAPFNVLLAVLGPCALGDFVLSIAKVCNSPSLCLLLSNLDKEDNNGSFAMTLLPSCSYF
jgi:hypothetical protein